MVGLKRKPISIQIKGKLLNIEANKQRASLTQTCPCYFPAFLKNMTKVFCDKCKKELGFMEARIIRMEDFNYYLFLKDGPDGHKIAMGELALCVDCKEKFGEKIKNFLNEP